MKWLRQGKSGEIEFKKYVNYSVLIEIWQ